MVTAMDPGSSEFWRLKIAAFLHDPPHKALLLGTGVDHESVAADLIEAATGSAPDWPVIRDADRIAAAADRQGVPAKFEAYWSRGARPLLRHPLSAETFDLGSLATINPAHQTDLVRKTIANTRSKYPDDRTMFLYLWRQLASDLKQAERNVGDAEQLGALWDLLPADTRFPGHTIWHHNRVVSALAGALPHPALLVIALGPVQPFIAAARKARDLWAGSFLLSCLAWQSMVPIVERFGPDAILFPDLRGQPAVDRWLAQWGLRVPTSSAERELVASLPNRYVAIVPAAEASHLASQVETAVQQSCKNLVRTTVAEASLTSIPPELIERQLQWLEVYSVVTEWPEYSDAPAARVNSDLERMLGPDRSFSGYLTSARDSEFFRPNLGTFYGRLHKLADSLMGSRKTLRGFSQGPPEAGYKCTLCGEREPLHPPDVPADHLGKLREFWKTFARGSGERNIDSDGSERLCAVCVGKRFLNLALERGSSRQRALGFPSTSEIAATSFKVAVLERLKAHVALREQLDSFVSACKAARLTQHGRATYTEAVARALRHARSESAAEFAQLDGEWLFEERYADNRIAAEDPVNLTRLQECRERLRSLGSAASRTGVSKPSPYYAIIMLDGDQMGEWVSGAHDCLPTIGEMLHSPADLDESLRKMRQPTSPSLQSAISAALAGFALDVVPYVVERQGLGKLIYAGGDDVLAMLPLGGLIETAIGLEAGFKSAALLDSEGRVNFGADALRPTGSGGSIHLGMGNRATASAGIVIAHHLHPLSDVLEEARDAEQAAKNEAGRNAFCVKVLKRSGETTKAYAHWQWAPFLRGLIHLFAARDGFSSRLVRRLELEGEGLAVHADLRDARVAIIRAALQRQQRGESLATMIREQFPDSASSGPFDFLADKLDALAHETQWHNAIALVSVAEFIARHMAEGTGRDDP
jgi:CRISPR-associated protein Cmr2